MAITITVEDGTNVADANSYMDVGNARAYAFDRGVTLSAVDDIVAAQLLNAMDFLATYRAKWKGIKTTATQALPFPRDNMYIDDVLFDPNAIPMELIHAQGQLVMALEAGIVLLPNVAAGLSVISEKIGPIETHYAAPSDMGSIGWQTSDFPTVAALLAPLLGEGGFRLRSVRI